VLVPVRQRFPHRALTNAADSARAELAASSMAGKLRPGSRVAIGAGSRGIAQYARLIGTVVDYFREAGMRPFIYPAMGSHGAATPEGQLDVLAHYGIDEASMGCPMLSRFEVARVGPTELGFDAVAGLDAWASDGIFVINRVKWHTSFAGEIESGLAKMLAIGSGKQAGAEIIHGASRTHGMTPCIAAAARRLIGTGKVLGGLAILEDAYHEVERVAVLRAEDLIEREAELLAEAKRGMTRLPVSAVDVLIVDEIGKNISGTGMDLKVVNRGPMGQYNPWPDTPRVERIFVRDLSPLSYGNSHGMGGADVIHARVMEKRDAGASVVNAVTAGSLALARTPIVCGTDRECLDLVLKTVGKPDPRDVTIAWIHNTLELDYLVLSENLLALHPEIERAGSSFDWPFDATGNLPDCVMPRSSAV
jgi:hypothetical protein